MDQRHVHVEAIGKVLNGKVACLPFSEQKAKVKEGDNVS